jgi:tryptophan synthase alpha chain
MRSEIRTDLSTMLGAVKEVTGTPAAIGFGINTPEQAKEMAACADGVIVGSAIVKIVAEHGRDAAPYIGAYVRKMKAAIREAEAGSDREQLLIPGIPEGKELLPV